MSDLKSFSIVIPAKNEAAGLKVLLPSLVGLYPRAEIIVVDDGSSDNTAQICNDNGVVVITHPYSKGNGAAIKAGARNASKDVIVFMDGDGQHSPEDVQALIDKINEGFEMVVGARKTFQDQAGLLRNGANKFYNILATVIVGHKVEDLTSGMRAVVRKRFNQFLCMLPNGFSYPTTSTMAFFRAGYSVAYVPIKVAKREGRGHINLFRDGVRFLLIIFKIGTLYSPLKVFLPVSFFFFLLGSGNYLSTYLAEGRFTNMSALLFVASIIVFLIGLVSEQVSQLIFAHEEHVEE